jgi:hypothetical protein
VLEDGRSSKCLDPRDKVYSALGLITPEATSVHQSIIPDYTMPLEAVQLCVFRTVTGMTHDLKILEHYDVSGTVRARPTWLVDWEFPRTYLNLIHRQHADLAIQTASIDANSSCLTVKGVLCGPIEATTQWNGGVREEMNQRQRRLELKRIHEWLHAQSPRADQASILAALSYCLFQTEIKEHVRRPASVGDELYTLSELNEVISKLLETDEDLFPNPWGYVTDMKAVEREILTALVSWWSLRSLAVLQSGHISLAPGHTKAGDIIAVILGLSHTVVLRPQADGAHEFVGLAFTPGFEWGEALVGELPANWKYVERHGVDWSWDSEFVDRDTGKSTMLDPRIEWEELEVEKNDPAAEILSSNGGTWPLVDTKTIPNWAADGYRNTTIISRVREEEASDGKYYKWPNEEYLLRHGARIETIRLV